MGIGYYIKLIVTLSLLSGILFLVLRFTRRMQLKRFSGDLKVIDRLAVDNGVTLIVVGHQETRYLMSIGGKEINVIEKLV